MAADQSQAGVLAPDVQQLDRFVRGIFAHASSDGVVSLRSFVDDNSNATFDIQPVRINGSLDPVITQAVAVASASAAAAEPVVFCPPLATFKDTSSASEEALSEGLVLSVDCDSRPSRARATLTQVLGTPTFVIASGGEWVDQDTGEIERKVHLHWRLRKPTTTKDEHARLKRARSIACDLVGADATCKSIVHPLRCAGSVHRKGEPRLAEIIEEHDIEIDLEAALEALELYAKARGGTDAEQADAQATPGSDTVLDAEGLLGCAERIPNSDTTDWHAWNRAGLAFWRGSNGSADGFDAFDLFSKKSSKYNAETTKARWKHYSKSKPTKIGTGSLIYWARKTDPKFQPREFDRDESAEEAFVDDGCDETPATEVVIEIITRRPLSAVRANQPEQVIRGKWAVRGNTTAISSGGGKGKTTATTQEFIEASLGLPIFGVDDFLPVRPLRCLYVNAEDQLSNLDYILGYQLPAYDLDYVPFDLFVISETKAGCFPLTPLNAARIAERINAEGYDIVGFDPAIGFLPSGFKFIDPGAVRAFLQQSLGVIQRETKAAIRLNAHDNKQGDALSGPADWGNFCRLALQLEHGATDDTRVITPIKSNFGFRFKKIVLQLDPATLCFKATELERYGDRSSARTDPSDIITTLAKIVRTEIIPLPSDQRTKWAVIEVLAKKVKAAGLRITRDAIRGFANSHLTYDNRRLDNGTYAKVVIGVAEVGTP